MTWHWTVAGAVVVGSAIYAVWTLMPSALRRLLATALLGLPLPGAIAARLRVHAASASSCGCTGCDRAAPVRDASQPQPIRLHRRSPGR